MKLIELGSRRLYLLNTGEIIKDNFQDDKYAIMFTATSEDLPPEECLYLESLLDPNCTEVYFVGFAAEKVHDTFDETIEDHGLFEILTTWVSEEPLEDICFYFLNVAGGKPKTLLAITNGSKEIEKILKGGIL